MFKRLMYLFTAGPELDSLIKKEKQERELAEFESNRYRLHLCYKHRQEPNHSHYSAHNCDYCKLLNNSK